MADGMRFAGRVFDGSGTAVNLATVNLYDVGTTTPVRSTTTSSVTGDWEIDYATRGLFDIEIVNGTTTRRITQDTEVQLKSAWIWNPDADEFALGVTRTEDVASVEVAYFEGDRVTPTDGDLAYISLRLSDSAGNQDEQVRIGWSATTVLNGATQDGDLILSALVDNTLTEFVRLDGSALQVLLGTTAVLSCREPDWLELGATSPKGYELIDSTNDLTNNTATSFITVTVTNVNHNALLIVDYIVTDSSQTKALAGQVYFAITRKPGENTGLSAVTAGLTQVAADSTTPVTMTATFANSALTGAASATQTFGLQVTANDSTNATPPDIRYRARLLTGIGPDNGAPGITMAAA